MPPRPSPPCRKSSRVGVPKRCPLCSQRPTLPGPHTWPSGMDRTGPCLVSVTHPVARRRSQAVPGSGGRRPRPPSRPQHYRHVLPQAAICCPRGQLRKQESLAGLPLLSQGSPGALRCCRSSGYCEEAGPRTSKPWAEAPFCWGDGRPLQALPHARVGAVGDKAPDVPPPLPGQQAQRLLGEHTREDAAGSVLEPQHLGAGSK